MPDDRTYGFSKNDAEALVQSIETRQMTFTEMRPRGGTARFQAILTEDLLAAVHPLRDPSTATAKILQRNSDGDLELSDDEKTVVNRFKNISIDAGTYIKIEMINGEWQPYAADCPGGSFSESL